MMESSARNWKRYIYDGPIYDAFDNMIDTDWYGETGAYSKERAISNLKHQYRIECNLPITTKLKLDTFYLKKDEFEKDIHTDPPKISEEEIDIFYEQLQLDFNRTNNTGYNEEVY